MTTFVNRQGCESEFNPKKIYQSITKAMKSGSGVYYPKIAQLISEEADAKFSKKEKVTHTEVDKYVLKKLFDYGQDLTANAYERYKTAKKYQQIDNIIDNDINGIVDGSNETAITENANKDAQMCSTQRDLIAGVVSRSYSERKLIPTHLLNAHREGIIHIHDTDYLINHIFNCCLINLKDMFTNGTVINGKLIETPKSFQTACTIATQISLQVANGQYGGQTFSVSHLAPYVRVSFDKWKKIIAEEQKEIGNNITDEQLETLAWKRTREEVKSGVQTIQFQENTFSSANGQTPFVSIFLYVNEEPEYKKETALIIEETLKLRLQGMKNEQGVWVTPAFPKLLYVLDENNVPRDSEYRYLTDLAIKCSAKRMNPDYISAKIMKELYQGQVFPCMGCVDGESVIRVTAEGREIEDTFEKVYEYFSTKFDEESQSEGNPNKIIKLEDVKIYDCKLHEYVDCHSIIRNIQTEWIGVTLDNGKSLLCTTDHPWTLVDRDNVMASELKANDEVYNEDGSISKIVTLISLKRNAYSYDVTTASEHFMVNGLYTHNCRSFLSPWKDVVEIKPITGDEEFELVE